MKLYSTNSLVRLAMSRIKSKTDLRHFEKTWKCQFVPSPDPKFPHYFEFKNEKRLDVFMKYYADKNKK